MHLFSKLLTTGQKWFFFLVAPLFLSGNLHQESTPYHAPSWEQMMIENLEEILPGLRASGIQPDALALGAPELIRYSLFRDYFETGALELLYTRHGSSGADFSIGPFQMKPSFAEGLESALADHPELRLKYPALLPGTASTQAERKLRLNRLKNQQMQLKYLQACYDYLNIRFEQKEFESESHRIAFFATAYNSGIDKPEQYLEHMLTRKIFPFGQHSPDPQESYGQLAVTAAKHLTERFNF